ncbi:MAG TPA: hypothetical protein VGE98_16545 [Thermoanaerobaculia bacterium]
MRKNRVAKLSLHRESVLQLERDEADHVVGGKTTQFGTLCHSCHAGCGNYTLFGSCTC